MNPTAGKSKPRPGVPGRGSMIEQRVVRDYLSAERRAFLSHASAASQAFFRPPCEASPKYALALGREPPSVIL